jgi:small GTP-binding protein
MSRLLSRDADARLVEVRDLLGTIRDALTRFDATPDDQATLAASIRQLDELFLLVVVGEFNAGKSAFVNALLGKSVVDEGVTPTTSTIQVLEYGDSVSHRVDATGLQRITAPAELLRDVHLVDTPGTNAILRDHERLTTDFVPRSDLVLFLTSADRPFTETERAFMEAIRDWGKKIVLVINKIDILASPAERDAVLGFVTRHARTTLRVDPPVFAVSSRLALRAKQGEPSVWATSGFEALERYIAETLAGESRVQLKLANPLGIGHVLAARYATIAAERMTLMKEDARRLADLERALVAYREDVAHGFAARMTAVEQVLADMTRRGEQYFEDTLRIGRLIDLLNRSRVQHEFEERVVADAPIQIERRVGQLIDWLVDQDFRQWEVLQAKLSAHSGQLERRGLGAPDVGRFHDDRARLLDSVGREAHRVVDTYDKRREAEALADQARVAVAATAAAGGAALGLGTLVTIAASTVAADITGLLLASVVLGVGFLIIPARRRRAKALLADKVATLRTRLTAALSAEFQRAQEHSDQRFTDAIAPYAQFVRAEERRWRDAHAALTAVRDRAAVMLVGLT